MYVYLLKSIAINLMLHYYSEKDIISTIDFNNIFSCICFYIRVYKT